MTSDLPETKNHTSDDPVKGGLLDDPGEALTGRGEVLPESLFYYEESCNVSCCSRFLKSLCAPITMVAI